MICLLCFHFCHLYSLLFVCKPCDQNRLEVMFRRTLKHTVDIHSHILVVVVQIMVVFCVYSTVHCAVTFEFAAFIGSVEFGICSCHWLWRVPILSLPFCSCDCPNYLRPSYIVNKCLLHTTTSGSTYSTSCPEIGISVPLQNIGKSKAKHNTV